MTAEAVSALMALLSTCAPTIDPGTAIPLIRAESGGHPWALGVNGGRVQPQPATLEQAAAAAKVWIGMGKTVDLGYAQINNRTAERLGLTVEQVLEPCVNLRAMERVLAENYTSAVARFGHGQTALQEALSMYNTGHFSKGVANGYVGRVYGHATK